MSTAFYLAQSFTSDHALTTNASAVKHYKRG